MKTVEEFIEERYSKVPYELEDIKKLMIEYAEEVIDLCAIRSHHGIGIPISSESVRELILKVKEMLK